MFRYAYLASLDKLIRELNSKWKDMRYFGNCYACLRPLVTAMRIENTLRPNPLIFGIWHESREFPIFSLVFHFRSKTGQDKEIISVLLLHAKPFCYNSFVTLGGCELGDSERTDWITRKICPKKSREKKSLSGKIVMHYLSKIHKKVVIKNTNSRGWIQSWQLFNCHNFPRDLFPLSRGKKKL